MTEEKLLELKRTIEIGKTKVSELTGKKEVLMSQLKKDWKCSTIKEAKVKLKSLQTSISDLEEKKELGITELYDKYEL